MNGGVLFVVDVFFLWTVQPLPRVDVDCSPLVYFLVFYNPRERQHTSPPTQTNPRGAGQLPHTTPAIYCLTYPDTGEEFLRKANCITQMRCFGAIHCKCICRLTTAEFIMAQLSPSSPGYMINKHLARKHRL